MVSRDLVVLGLLALSVVVFAVIVIMALRRKRARDAAMEALFAARDWSITEGRRNRRRERIVTPSDGAWRLILLGPKRNNKSRTRTAASLGSTEIRFPEPAFRGGLAVFAPAPAAGMGNTAAALLGLMGSVLSREVMHRLVGEELAERVGDLEDYPAPEGTGMMILATADPAFGLDIHVAARVLTETATRLGGKFPPAIMASDTGMGLRVGGEIQRAEDLADFVDIALRLRDALPRSR